MKHHLVEVAVPFDHEVYRSHCTQHFDSNKRPGFVCIKWMVVMTGIAVLNGTKVTVVTTPNTPDTFSKHVIVTYCASFKRPDSPNLHCIGSGVNSTVTVRCRQRHRGKNSPTSYKSNTNCTDLSERKISLTWLITSTV
jgi:hypothetical protein